MVERTLYPLLPVIGPRHGSAVGAIMAGVRSGDWRLHDDGTAEVGGVDPAAGRVPAHRPRPPRPRGRRGRRPARGARHRARRRARGRGAGPRGRASPPGAAQGGRLRDQRSRARRDRRRRRRCSSARRPSRTGWRPSCWPSSRLGPTAALPDADRTETARPRRGNAASWRSPAPDRPRSARVGSVEAAHRRDASLRPVLVLAGTALALYVADQVTKALVVANLPSASGRRHRRPRAASGTSRTPAPRSASSPAPLGSSSRSPSSRIGMVAYFHRTLRDRGAVDPRHPRRRSWPGALGNLTDRVRLGYVVDFVSVGIGDMRFPTFNVADSAVVLGIGALVAYLTFFDQPGPARGRRVSVPPVEDRTVEGPAPAGRVDLAVAAVGGISRAHAQRLIGDGRALVDGRRRRSSDRLGGGERIRVELTAPPDETARAGVDPARRRLRGRVDAHRRQAGRPRRAPVGRPRHRDAGQRPPRPRARPRRAARLDRRRRPARDRASARQGDERADRGRQDRCRPGQPDAPVRRPQHREGVPRPRARRAALAARPRRGADRPRSARPAADGGRRRRPRSRPPSTRSLGTGGGYALLALHPLTGRTHQIRAHLSYLGLPIAGDLRYGGGEGPGGLRRQFLHAARLGLERPLDGRRLRPGASCRRPGRLPGGVRGHAGRGPAAGGRRRRGGRSE